MKNKLSYYFLAAMFLMASLPGSYGQSVSITEPSCRERVTLYTDRSVYISGESINFSAFLAMLEGECTGISRVLYCELITPDGTRVSEGKFELIGGRASGKLQIPGYSISGMYYFKAYTRIMRNEGPGTYCYQEILVINPDSREVLPPGEEDTSDLLSLNPEFGAHGPGVDIMVEEKVFSPREIVRFTLASSPGMADSLDLGCISVAPALAFSAAKMLPPPIQGSGETFFWPDLKGVALSGRLQDINTGKPLPNALVNLSIMGEKDMMATRTDSSGRFNFDITGSRGSKDVFLSSEKIPGTEPSILVDNDYCTQAVSLPSPILRLDTARRYMVEEMVRNCRMEVIFYAPSADTAEKDGPSTSFYGSPKEVIRLDKYIELPTLEEYFNELPSQVKVRRTGGKKQFRFSSTQAEMVIYDPLVLIDWLAVEDIDRILAMPPREIERIELINAPYIKGQMTYGGVINFISRKNDFAGIDLPESGIFIHYDFFLPSFSKIIDSIPPDHMPFLRNTLLWYPDLQLSPSGKTECSFITPDNPGEYLILFRGITTSGEKIISYREIEIK
jgi:hypothetical protein